MSSCQVIIPGLCSIIDTIERSVGPAPSGTSKYDDKSGLVCLSSSPPKRMYFQSVETCVQFTYITKLLAIYKALALLPSAASSSHDATLRRRKPGAPSSSTLPRPYSHPTLSNPTAALYAPAPRFHSLSASGTTAVEKSMYRYTSAVFITARRASQRQRTTSSCLE